MTYDFIVHSVSILTKSVLITDIMRRTDRLKFLRVTVFFLVYSIIHIVCDPSEKVKLNEESSTTVATDTLEDEGTIPSPTGSNLPIKVSLFLVFAPEILVFVLNMFWVS